VLRFAALYDPEVQRSYHEFADPQYGGWARARMTRSLNSSSRVQQAREESERGQWTTRPRPSSASLDSARGRPEAVRTVFQAEP